MAYHTMTMEEYLALEDLEMIEYGDF